MTQTNFKSSHANAMTAIVDDAIQAAEKDGLFGELIGDENSIIYRVKGLEGEGKGVTLKGINIDANEPLPGVVATGSVGVTTTAEGKEQNLSVGNAEITIRWHQTGISIGADFQNQYLVLDLVRLKETAIKRWMASLIEGGYSGVNATSLGFNYGLINTLLASAPDYLYPVKSQAAASGAATSLATGGFLTLDSLVDFHAAAYGGTWTDDNGTGTYKKFRGANAVGYSNKLFLIANPQIYVKMRKSSDFKDLMSSYQFPKGINPLWDAYISKYVVCEYCGIVCLASDRMPVYNTGGATSDVKYGKFLLMGAQGGMYARGMTLPVTTGTDKTGVIKNIYPQHIYGTAQTVTDDDSKAFDLLIGLATLE